MKDLRANGRKLIYWSNLIDKYQQYSAEKFGSVDSYQLNKEHLGSTSVEQEKQIREEARGDMHLRADRADLAKSQRELRKKEQELAKHPKSEALQKEVNDLQTKYTVQKKQIHLQHLVNNQEGGEERSSQVQELLKKGEAVVEIKRMEGKSKQENGVTMPSEASYMALINLPGLTSPRAIYLGEEYLLSRYAVHHNNDLMFLNLHDSENAKAFELLWKGIDDFLIKNNVKRIYFKSEGVYADFNINTLFDRKHLY
ncbi:MAG: hypothetical protein MUF42_11895 [Cytophagaceae bacterium]|nr:hypothetical protein [Cytophagaceae bacterium]